MQISETISPKSLNNLIRLGLGKRFPEESNIWAKEVNAIKLACQKDVAVQQKKAQNELDAAKAQTESSIRFAIVNAVFSRYPFVVICHSGVQLTLRHVALSIVADASCLFQHSPRMRNQD